MVNGTLPQLCIFNARNEAGADLHPTKQHGQVANSRQHSVRVEAELVEVRMMLISSKPEVTAPHFMGWGPKLKGTAPEDVRPYNTRAPTGYRV